MNINVYSSNRKNIGFKEGEKFKKDDVIAANTSYFHDFGKDTTYVSGTLAKIAIAMGPYTFEDSSIISETLSKKMASYITMSSQVFLGPNANVEKMVSKGDHIKSGESLIVFENSFDEVEANKLLDTLDSELKQNIGEFSKNVKKSKYTGEVVEIRIFYNVKLPELSESLQKIIKKLESTINKRNKALKKITGENNKYLDTITCSYIESNKLLGKDAKGVAIEFFVKYKDELFIGDKISFQTALKSVIGDIVSEDEAPYSEFRKDEEISAIVSSLGVLNRMTEDVVASMYTNKVLIELKNKVKEIWG